MTRRMGRWGLLCLVLLFFAAPAANAVTPVGPPTVTIEQPTTDPTYVTANSTVDLSGSASDDVAVTSVTWTNGDTGDSGIALG